MLSPLGDCDISIFVSSLPQFGWSRQLVWISHAPRRRRQRRVVRVNNTRARHFNKELHKEEESARIQLEARSFKPSPRNNLFLICLAFQSQRFICVRKSSLSSCARDKQYRRRAERDTQLDKDKATSGRGASRRLPSFVRFS